MLFLVAHDDSVNGVDPDAPEPLYEQLAAVLREQIRTGVIAPRRMLPSNRTLTQEYGVARGTASRAVKILVDEGWAYVVRGRGVFSVAEADRPAEQGLCVCGTVDNRRVISIRFHLGE